MSKSSERRCDNFDAGVSIEILRPIYFQLISVSRNFSLRGRLLNSLKFLSMGRQSDKCREAPQLEDLLCQLRA
jgi:hypothetical protein